MKLKKFLELVIELSFKTTLCYFVFFVAFFSVPLFKVFWNNSGVLNAISNSSSKFHNQKFLIIGEKYLEIEIVEKTADLVTGLSGRESLSQNQGMFFVFNKSDLHGIWMKNMNFPIDIIWIAENMQVVHIEKNVLPITYPKIFKPNAKATYVLEVNAGFAKENGIKIGDLVSLL